MLNEIAFCLYTVSSTGTDIGVSPGTNLDSRTKVIPRDLIYRKCFRKQRTNFTQTSVRCAVDAAFVKLLVLCCHGRFDVIVVP